MPWNWPRSSLHEVQSGGDPLALDVLGVNHTNDGEHVELAHVRFVQNTISDPLQMHILHQGSVPAPQDLKQSLAALKAEGPTSLRQVNAVNRLVGKCTAKAVHQFARQQRFSVDEEVDVIGSSGCLVSEPPPSSSSSTSHQGSSIPEQTGNSGTEETTELGDLSLLAAKTTKTSLGDFRASLTASGLPPDAIPRIFSSLLAEQPDSPELVEGTANGPLGIAFAALEGCVGRPFSAPDEDENERVGLVGHVQSGDNFFDVRRKVVKFWGECPDEMVGPTRQIVLECEC